MNANGLKLAAALGSCLLVAACGTQCRVDADCPSGEVCNVSNYSCQTAQSIPCRVEADCPSGHTCSLTTLVCQPTTTQMQCQSASDCPSGQTCNTNSYTCQVAATTTPQCDHDNQCGIYQHCVSGICSGG